jgi:hypothetical protein
MINKNFRTPKISCENVVSFTCSNGALEPVLKLLENIQQMGDMGCSRDIVIQSWGGDGGGVLIDFDGDGSDRVDNISINGMTKKQWLEEWERLEEIQKSFKDL